MAKHQRAPMKFKGREAQKHVYSNGRAKNVWYYIFECPECGATKAPLMNTSRGKTFFCEGK